MNNAGVTVSKPALQQTLADYDEVLDTNLKGGWLVAANRPGRFINVASILAERVAGGVAPYAISDEAGEVIGLEVWGIVPSLSARVRASFLPVVAFCTTKPE